MGGMPSCRGTEWKKRAGDGSHKRYQDNMAAIFPNTPPMKCIACGNLVTAADGFVNWCDLMPDDNRIVSSVTGRPDWCPLTKKDGDK
jgi:hypothetical protein